MAYDANKYKSAANLLGNTDVPRDTLPMVRSSSRRLDPDGTSATPYYSSVAGKFLRIEHTYEVATVVTVKTTNVSLSANSLAAIITDINAADPTNLEAIELDGFLAVRNANPGKTHYIKIMPYSVDADDAAPLLGFVRYPLPGSISVAGNLSAAPGSRFQSNPQTTALLARDNDLTAKELNRPLAGIVEMLEDLKAEVSRNVVVYKDFGPLTCTTHPLTGEKVVTITSDEALYIPPSPFVTPSIEEMRPYYHVMDIYGREIPADDVLGSGVYKLEVGGAHYGTNATPLSTLAFATWGTPDGKSIVSDTVRNKDKQAATAITSIVGNVVYCAGATFVTKKVIVGDPVYLTASNLQPFDHTGWFAVDAVIDEEHLALRPMGANEYVPSGSLRPRRINPTAGGTLRVAFGNFVPLAGIMFSIPGATATDAYTLRLPIAVRFSEALQQDQALNTPGSSEFFARTLFGHINAVSNAHAASAISGFTSAAAWKDGSFEFGANLREFIEAMIAKLSSTTAGENTDLLGAQAISIVGSTPNSLSAGSLKAQLTSLLTHLQTHVNDGAAHAGGAATYSGSPPWADGLSIPGGVTIDAAIDEIVSTLASSTGGADGARKIGIAARDPWLGGRVNGAQDLWSALNEIVTDLGVTTSGDDGAERIGAAATADLTVGSVRSQLDALATGWGKLNRANTWSATQTLNGTASDTNAAMTSTYVPSTRKLLWEITLESGGAGGTKARMFAGRNTTWGTTDVGFELVINASWDGTNWNRDGAGPVTRLVLFGEGLYLYRRAASAGASWADTSLTWGGPIMITAEKLAASTSMGAAVTQTNVARVQGFFRTNGSGGFTYQDGFNHTLSMPDATTVRVTIPGTSGMTNPDDYTIIPVVTRYINAAASTVNTPVAIRVVNKTVSSFDLKFYDVGGFAVYVTTEQVDCNFVVYGPWT